MVRLDVAQGYAFDEPPTIRAPGAPYGGALPFFNGLLVRERPIECGLVEAFRLGHVRDHEFDVVDLVVNVMIACHLALLVEGFETLLQQGRSHLGPLTCAPVMRIFKCD